MNWKNCLLSISNPHAGILCKENDRLSQSLELQEDEFVASSKEVSHEEMSLLGNKY